MTKICTTSRFRLEGLLTDFPNVLTFSGAPTDSAGAKEVTGDVDTDALLDAVNRAIRQFNPDQPLAEAIVPPPVHVWTAPVIVEPAEVPDPIVHRRRFTWRRAVLVASYPLTALVARYI